jgi:hypothetical protein
MRSSRPALVLLLLLAGGCVQLQQLIDPDAHEGGTTVVPSSPFSSPGPGAAVTQASYAPASDTTLALRVDMVGRKVLAANPQTGLKPYFATVGAGRPEVFHQGTKLVSVTDSLVKACQTEGQLAAVLCLELAKMAAERDALTPPRARVLEQRPPPDVPIGNAGQAGAVDQARLVELARFDNQRRNALKPVPTDPKVLAGTMLANAGYAPAELDAVQPLLRQAQGNYVVEKQLKTAGTGGWVPQTP